MKAYVDGQLMPLQEAAIPITHRGYLLGEGVFETMRTRNGQVFRLDDHLERLQRGLDLLGFDAMNTAQRAIDALVGDGEQYLRINIHAGTMENLGGEAAPHVTGIARPLNVGTRALTLATSTFRKDPNPLSNVKTLNYLPHILAKREAMRSGADDALLLNSKGFVAEASTSNLFALIDGTLFAPDAASGALEGVTRKAVLELANEEGYSISASLHANQLHDASEVFVTNTTRGIVPVIALDGKAIGAGEAGECTKRLSNALEASRDL